MRDVSGMLGSFVRSALSAKQLQPEVETIIGSLRNAVEAVVEECGIVSGDSMETVARALETAIFFGIRPRTAQNGNERHFFEFEAPHFLDLVRKTSAGTELLQEVYLVHTEHGLCRSVLRLSLARRNTADLLKQLNRLSARRWRPEAICCDLRAIECLKACLEPLGAYDLHVDFNHNRLDRAFVAFDSGGMLRLLGGGGSDTPAGSRVRVTAAGCTGVNGVYLRLDGSTFEHQGGTNQLYFREGVWYIERARVKLYSATSSDPSSPPATGWYCRGEDGKLPPPVVRRIGGDQQAATQTAPANTCRSVFPDAVQCASELRVVAVAAEVVEIQREVDEKKEEMPLSVHRQELNHQTVLVTDEDDPKDFLEMETRYLDTVASARRELAVALADQETLAAEFDEGAIQRALELFGGALPAPPRSTLTLSDAMRDAACAPLRSREAESARALWRVAWRDASRALTGSHHHHQEAFEIVVAECIGVVVEEDAVVYSISIALERCVAFSPAEDVDAYGKTYATRLDDVRLRRPRKVAVARASLERLAKLGPGLDGPLLRSLESKLLAKTKSSFGASSSALSALASPATRVVDDFLKSLKKTSGTSLKLFVDEALLDDANVVALEMWQHRRQKEGKSRQKTLSAWREDALLKHQAYRCAGCGEHISSNVLGGRNFAPCRLVDALFCKKRCHDDAHRVLPWRILSCADFVPHRVSRAAATFLDDRSVDPLLKVSASVPALELDRRLDSARQLRTRLVELRNDALDGRPGALLATRRIVEKLAPTKLYLALDPPDYWSLEDLLRTEDLLPFLSELIADATQAFSDTFSNRIASSS